MEITFVSDVNRVKKSKIAIEKAIDVKLNITPEKVEISGEDGLAEHIAVQIVEAIDFGFKTTAALNLKNEEFMFEKISIKDYVRTSRLQTIKGRIIGKQGRAKEIISELTDCDIVIKDYYVGIIGRTHDVIAATNALKDLILGLPHAKVYAYLEKSRRLREEKFEEEGSLK